MRHTVRAFAASPVVVATFVGAVMLGAAVIGLAAGDDESAETGPVESVAPSDSQSPAAQAPEQRDDDRGTGLAGAVAGFGLLAVWVIGGGTVLYRSRRRQPSTTADPAADNEETTP